MNYKSIDVKRAIRTFRNAFQDLLNANYNLFESQIDNVVSIIHNDPTISVIMSPYLNYKLDLSQIEEDEQNGWGSLHLPTSIDERIAYVVQLLERFHNKKLDLTDFIITYFQHQNYDHNLRDLNKYVISPTMRDIFIKLGDLQEDELQQDEKEVSPAQLQIIVHGDFKPSAPVIIGNNNVQTTTTQGVSDTILAALIEKGFSEKEVASIRDTVNDLAEEVTKPEPDKSKLRKAFESLYSFGKSLAVNVAANAVCAIPAAQEAAKNVLQTFS